MNKNGKAFQQLMNLSARRQKLGMSCAALAERSGVPLRTVQRILAGNEAAASFANVLAIADALGTRIDFDREAGIEELLEQQAQRKAERIVSLVQGTSLLEGQGMDAETLRRLIRQTARELLTGSKRKLWSKE